MPGFSENDFQALAREPTPEELEEMRRDGMSPLTGDALTQAMMKSGPSKKGINYGEYVPSNCMETFFRLRQAKFNLAEFERLGDIDYPHMITLRWMQRADSKAEADYVNRNNG